MEVIIGSPVSSTIPPGAKYVATGRGLPTYRRPFIGETEAGTTKLKKAGYRRVVWVCWARQITSRNNNGKFARSPDSLGHFFLKHRFKVQGRSTT